MRYADTPRNALCLAALCATLAGCTSMSAPLASLKQALGATPSANVAGSTTAASTSTSAPPTSPAPAPSAAVQRSFDEALRAMRAGRTEEAERGLVALTLSHPELGGPHANLGILYARASKLAEAVTQLELAVQASPGQAIYFNQLGIAYRQQGEFSKARSAYEKAMALDATYASPCLNLGILYDLYLGDGQRALERYERYLALSPSGDATVTKWVADLKNRKPPPVASRKEKE